MEKKLKILVILCLIVNGTIFSAEIDSVWFEEETFCNDSNTVRICYILRDGPTNIRISASGNNGVSWDVPLNTLYEAYGDIGNNIESGTHCFLWNVRNDYPNYESRNFIIKVQAQSSFIDTFSFLDTTRYVINGNDGYVDMANGYFVLTRPTTDRNGRIMSVDSVYTDTLYVSFDFRMWQRGGATDGLGYQGADGISFILSHYVDPPLALGGALGIRYTGGIGVELDNWYNGSPCDINSNHIGISIDADCNGTGLPTPIYQTGLPFELIDGNWHHVDISIEGQHWRVWVDSILYIDIVLSPSQYQPFWAYVGFAASTGASYCWQVIDNFRVVSPYLFTVESEQIARSSVDSYNPRINIICPEEPIIAGDSIMLHWNITDAFFEPRTGFEISLNACGHEARFITYDTSFIMPTPRINCPNASFSVTTMDSFCNISTATCNINIEYRPFQIAISLQADTVICLPNGFFTPETLALKAIVSNIGTGRADSVKVNIHTPSCLRSITGTLTSTIAPFLPAQTDTLLYYFVIDRACIGRTECISAEAVGF